MKLSILLMAFIITACTQETKLTLRQLSQSCAPGTTQSCSILNLQGSQTCNQSGTSLNNCDTSFSYSCDEGFYYLNGLCLSQMCIPSSITTCSITNGIGLLVCDNLGSSRTCNIQDCNSGYHEESEMCESDMIDCSVEIINAEVANKTWEGSTYSACTLVACSAGSHVNNNICESNVIACSNNGGDGQASWNGVEFDECILSSCQSLNQRITSDNLDCEDKPITGASFSIQNKETSGIVYGTIAILELSATNAQTMKISETIDCSSGSVEPFSSIKNYTLLNLDQNSNLSILFNNGVQEVCIHVSGIASLQASHSFISDSTFPVVVDTYSISRATVFGIADLVFPREFSSTNFSFAYGFMNTSNKTIDGLVTEALAYPLNVSLSEQVNIGQFLTGTTISGYSLCNDLTSLAPQQTCIISMVPQFNIPLVTVPLENNLASFKVNFPHSAQTFNNTLEFKRIYAQSEKKIIAMMGHGVDYGLPQHQEAGSPKGMLMGKIDMLTQTYEYAAPCSTQADGSVGDYRGIYPYIDRAGNNSTRVIGDKVYFSGRGCSYNGTELVYERWGLWEYDSIAPQATSIRKISHNITNLTHNINPEYSRPGNHTSIVLNNNLYFTSPTKLIPQDNDQGGFRDALFEFNPSSPLSLINPKEIYTGYELAPAHKMASYTSSTTTHNNKLYFLAIYTTSSSPVEFHHGVMEYDPSQPISYNDPQIMEANDNPRVLWSLPESQYSATLMEYHGNGFQVNNDEFIFSANLPADLDNPNQTQSGNGRELVIVRRSDSEVFSFDLCSGSCSSDINHITQVGQYYLMSATIYNQGQQDRTVVVVKKTLNMDLKYEYEVVQQFNTNLSGSDISPDLFRFKMIKRNNQVFIPLRESETEKNLYVFDADTESLTPSFTGLFKGITNTSAESFADMILTSNNLIAFRSARTGTNQASFNIFSPDLSQNAINPTSPNANHIAKFIGYPNSFSEDNDFYYVFRSRGCTNGKSAWYLDSMTKNLDYFMQASSIRFSSLCDAPIRYTGELILIIKD